MKKRMKALTALLCVSAMVTGQGFRKLRNRCSKNRYTEEGTKEAA